MAFETAAGEPDRRRAARASRRARRFSRSAAVTGGRSPASHEAPCGFLAGIDPSEVMVRLARRRLRRRIEAGPRRDRRSRRARRSPTRTRASTPRSPSTSSTSGRTRSPTSARSAACCDPAGACCSAIGPATRPLAALPATVYALRSVDEIEALLAEAGFAAIRSTERAIGKPPRSPSAMRGARCPHDAARTGSHGAPKCATGDHAGLTGGSGGGVSPSPSAANGSAAYTTLPPTTVSTDSMLLDPLLRHAEVVRAEHREVGVHAGRDAALDVLLLAEPCAARR